MNMNREYRKELTKLRRELKAIGQMVSVAHDCFRKEAAVALGRRDGAIRQAKRAGERIQKRIKILEGRLS